MSKKLLAFIFAAIFCIAAISAQNLTDNKHQKAGQEYEKQAREAMDAGNYDDANKYAELSSEEYRKSHDYANDLKLKFRAANAINLAQSTITDVSNVKTTADFYAKEIAAAKVSLAEARKLYKAESWEESRAKANEALSLLKDIRRVEAEPKQKTTSNNVLPRYYTVMSRPSNTDCFWNISGMDGIYGDPTLWKNLWNGNREAMKDSNNPNLIYPGMVIEIPSLKGEVREGNYDPKKNYSAIKK